MIAFIVPVFNETPEDIAISVGSILAIEADVRVLLVDDCSDEPLPPQSASVTLIRHERNGGPQVALNTGIQYALDEWGDVPISRLDVGDEVLPERARQLEQMIASKRRAVFSDHWDRLTDSLYSAESRWDRRIYQDCQFTLLSAIWRPSVWREVGGFDVALPYCHDWDFCLKVQKSVGWSRYVGGPTVRCGVMPGGYSDRAGAARDRYTSLVYKRAQKMKPWTFPA